jgi:outer membrane protein TolC
VQQNVYTARRDLASSYFAYIVGTLRLKQSVGTLTEQDIENINRQLRG